MRKAITLSIVALFASALLLCAGCTQQTTNELTADVDTSQQFQPEVETLDDGTVIQRTPTESADDTTLDTSYIYYYQTDDTTATEPYNTYYLHADEKGCNACHENLADTLANMDYDHVDLRNSYGIQITEQMCEDCHTFGYGYITNQNSFGSLIHGIHGTDGMGTTDDDRAATATDGKATTSDISCWNCHVATGDGDGMQLWDDVKHQQLRGITAVADVTGDFTYDQSKITAPEDLFDFGWRYYDLDWMRAENTESDAPLDQDMFDNWTITISGAVNKEVTYTLPELIAKYGSETVPVTFDCTLNPTGGPLLGNCEYTGVPLNKLLEEAGLTDDAGAITAMASDGFAETVQLSNYTDAWLAYEIGGEPLSWAHGYPVQLIVSGSAAPASVKEVSDIVVDTKEEAANLHEWNGWPNEVETGDYYTQSGWPFVDSNGYVNKPNIGLFDFSEGQVIKTGEPYTFSGYATAYNEKIVAVEFSMDGGTTWTRYETPDTTTRNWVNWHFTFTPDTDTAYVLSMRSVTETGRVTEQPIEVMFNAHSE